MTKVTDEMIEELYKTLLTLKTVDDCDIFFADLCTHKEIENMAQRIVAARLLKKGETYNEIMDKTGISSATLARVSNCVKYGKGYTNFIDIKK